MSIDFGDNYMISLIAMYDLYQSFFDVEYSRPLFCENRIFWNT